MVCDQFFSMQQSEISGKRSNSNVRRTFDFQRKLTLHWVRRSDRASSARRRAASCVLALPCSCLLASSAAAVRSSKAASLSQNTDSLSADTLIDIMHGSNGE